MQLYFRGLTCGATTMEVEPQDTVWSLKLRLQSRRGIPPQATRLIFAGKLLENRRTLADYSITQESTLHYILQLNTYSFHGIPWSVRETTINLRIHIDSGRWSWPVDMFTCPHLLKEELCDKYPADSLRFYCGGKELVNLYLSFAESGVPIGGLVEATDTPIPDAECPVRSLVDMCVGAVVSRNVNALIKAHYMKHGSLVGEVKQRLLQALHSSDPQLENLLDAGVKSLQWTGREAVSNPALVSMAVSNCPNLVKLHLDGSTLGASEVEAIASSLPLLENLSLACVNWVGEPTGFAPNMRLLFKSCPRLRGLNLSRMPTECMNVTLPIIYELGTELLQLNIASTSHITPGLEALQNLTALDVSMNNFQDPLQLHKLLTVRN